DSPQSTWLVAFGALARWPVRRRASSAKVRPDATAATVPDATARRSKRSHPGGEASLARGPLCSSTFVTMATILLRRVSRTEPGEQAAPPVVKRACCRATQQQATPPSVGLGDHQVED